MRFLSFKKRKFKTKSHSSPKIIVDGPNVSKDQNIKGDVPEARRFCILIEQLCQEYQLDHIEIFVSAKLKHEIDDLDIIRNLQGKGILIVTPAARDDDFFALKHAVETDGWILSNDRYLDYQRKDPKLGKWLKDRRITFIWHKMDRRFTFGKNIDYMNFKSQK